MTRKAITSISLIILCCAVLLTCQGGDFNELISVDEVALTVLSGDNQSAEAGEVLPNPIVVQVGLISGQGVPGKDVVVNVVKGGGVVREQILTTGPDGTVSFIWELGLVVGPQELKISSMGFGETTVRANAVSKPGTLTLLSGDGQAAYTGDTLSVPVVISLRDDQGAPIPGRKVAARPDSLNGAVFPPQTLTDQNGRASFCWITGQTPGNYHLTILAGTPSDVSVAAVVSQGPPDVEVTVFDNAVIEYASGNQTITAETDFPVDQYQTVQAELTITSPCRNCHEDDCDPWDRIGNITIEAPGPGGQTVKLELIKFITPYGNNQTYTADLSAYGSLLRGRKTMSAFISTFRGRWELSLQLKFRRSTLNPAARAAYPLFFSQLLRSDAADQEITLEVPDNGKIRLAYRSTGHNSQGRNCDEFCQKVNEIYLDGMLVKSFIPWRDDCGSLIQFNRCGNPQSVQLSRAGWCPGDIVPPEIIDLGYLPPGQHTFRFRIVNVEPQGGYWRTSLDLRVYR